MRACGTGLRKIRACSVPGRTMSAAYFAAPETLSAPSMRMFGSKEAGADKIFPPRNSPSLLVSRPRENAETEAGLNNLLAGSTAVGKIRTGRNKEDDRVHGHGDCRRP